MRIRGTGLLLLLGVVVLAFTQAGGCDLDDDDIRITVTNDYGDELWIEAEHPVFGWTHKLYIDEGETRVLELNEDYDGEDLRALDDDRDRVADIEVRDGLTWTIPAGGS
ncbi:MAG: hypothetical protein ACYTAF_07405 [Planctomycetota bacterium]|jgi:hypothetical protein